MTSTEARLDIVTGKRVEGGHVFRAGQLWRRKSDLVEFRVVMTDPQGLAAHMRRVGAGPDDHELVKDWLYGIYYADDIELVSEAA